MQTIWQKIKSSAAAAASFLWERTGTLAAVALLAGTAGMGVYHLVGGTPDLPAVRCYAGLKDSPGAVPPQGVLPLAAAPGEFPSVSHVRMELNPAGQVARMLHVDAHGARACLPGSPVAELRMEYDPAGKLVRKASYDAGGRPVAGVDGVAVRLYGYDAEGRLLSEEFRDAGGMAVVPLHPGYARMERSYDERGRVAEIRYLNAAGGLLQNEEGEEHVVFTYDDRLHTATRRNLVGGRLADNRAGVAEQREEWAADGSTTCRRWYNAAGSPVPAAAARAAAVQVAASANGSMQCTRYCGLDGSLCRNGRACAEHVVRRNADSRTVWECYNAADGLPCNNPAAGYAEHITELDDAGQPVREYFWDERGLPCHCCEKRHVAADGVRYVLALYRDGTRELLPE